MPHEVIYCRIYELSELVLRLKDVALMQKVAKRHLPLFAEDQEFFYKQQKNRVLLYWLYGATKIHVPDDQVTLARVERALNTIEVLDT